MSAATTTRDADATARDHLWVRAPTVRAAGSVAEARKTIAASAPSHFVYALDEQGRLVGALPVTALLEGSPERLVAPMLVVPQAVVRPDDDQEQVAVTAARHALSEVPVVEDDGRFLGIIPASALLAVLHHEHVEDIDRLSGVLRQTEHAANALVEPPSRRVRERLPWLLVGLAGSAVATAVVASFEAALERRVAVAFFMPAIVYLADAIGTQTEAIAVRGLSFLDGRRAGLFLDEMRTGFLLGLALAVLSFPPVWLVFGDFRLAVAVGSAVVVAGTIATGVGLGFPLLLSRLGQDPAFGSGPLATVVQDVLSLVTYLVVAELVL